MKSFPDIAVKIMEELCQRLDRGLEHALETMGARTVEARGKFSYSGICREVWKGAPQGNPDRASR